MKPKKQFRPADLRTVLTVLLALVTLGGAAAFYWGVGQVRDYSISVNQRLADADASAKQIDELQTLKGQLTQSNSLVQKANELFATPATYQSQVLTDLKNYADAAGISIATTNFSDPSTTGTHNVTVTFQNPVSYTGLITFLTNVESNLPKLQISALALSRTDGGDANSVTTGDITIEISVR